MTDNDITTICGKIESLHDKIIKSKFSEMVTESEMICLILAVQELNRQKAEIERLKNECFCLANERDAYKDVLDTAVTEAVKEFAARLKDFDVDTHYSYASIVYELSEEDIDNLVKEMVGADNG